MTSANRKLLALLIQVGVLSVGPLARAETKAIDEGPSPRVGVTLGATQVMTHWPTGEATRFGAITVGLEIGADLNHLFSFYLREQYSTLVFSDMQMAMYGVFELNPTPNWSVGTGLGMDHHVMSGAGTRTAVSVPFVLRFHFRHAPRDPHFLLGVQGGISLDEPPFNGHSSLTFGYAWR